MAPPFTRVAVLGTGLIGGSFGLAARKALPGARIVGWDKPEVLKRALELGIIDEAEDLISENKKSPTINAALVLGAQKAEHYEIATYGTLREWARALQREDVARVLDGILAEEKAADAKLTKLGLEQCNAAAEGGEDMRMAA